MTRVTWGVSFSVYPTYHTSCGLVTNLACVFLYWINSIIELTISWNIHCFEIYWPIIYLQFDIFAYIIMFSCVFALFWFFAPSCDCHFFLSMCDELSGFWGRCTAIPLSPPGPTAHSHIVRVVAQCKLRGSRSSPRPVYCWRWAGRHSHPTEYLSPRS